jgi:2-succinyl-5-enolpyruvyl-6-hydroxy-3-cyclohexene-1-carboxylate synthase
MEQKRLPVFSFDERGFKGLSYGQVLSYSSSELLKDETFWSILKKTHARSLSGTPLGQLNSLMIKYSNSDISKIAQLEFALEDDAIVYLGNSLVIRFYELINHKKHVYYGNRGVNGIDGQISTAIGLALSTDKMVYGIVGDLTALYDLSAMRDLPQNLRIVIVNNSGGRIFQTMDLNPKLFLEHTKNFEAIASAFDLSYARNDFKQLKNVQIFELETNPEETMAFLKEWHR